MKKDRLLIYIFSILIGLCVFAYKTNKDGSFFKINEEKYLIGDAKNFYDRALSLLEYGNYTDNSNINKRVYYYRPPGYPLLLSALIYFTNNSLGLILVLQVLLFSLVPLLLYEISSNLVSRNVGIVSGVIAILFGPFWNLTLQFVSEWFSLVLWLFAIYFMIKFKYANAFKYLYLSGIFGGLAALTRGQFLYIVPFLLLLVYEKKQKFLINSLKFLLLFFLPVFLWGCFTYIKSDVFVMVSTQGPFALWWGNSPRVVIEQMYPVWNNNWDRVFYDRSDLIGDLLSDTGKPNSWFIYESFGFVFNYPLEFLKIYFFKFAIFFGFDFSNGNSFKNIANMLYINSTIIISIPGIIIWKKKNTENNYFVFAVLISVLFVIMSLLTASLTRYRLTCLDPVFLIFASVYCLKIIEFVKHLFDKKERINKTL